MCRDTVTKSCRAICPPPSSHGSAWCTAPCRKDLYTIPGSWQCPSSSMACIPRHVTHWACLECSGSTCTAVCSSSRQYSPTSHSHWRGVVQHSTGHNKQPDQLHAAWGKWCSHQIVTGFLNYAPTFFLRYLWPTNAYLYPQSCESHQLWINELI